MNDKQIRAMIMAIVGELDYDIAKDLDPRLAEEPAEAKRSQW